MVCICDARDIPLNKRNLLQIASSAATIPLPLSYYRYDVSRNRCHFYHLQRAYLNSTLLPLPCRASCCYAVGLSVICPRISARLLPAMTHVLCLFSPRI